MDGLCVCLVLNSSFQAHFGVFLFSDVHILPFRLMSGSVQLPSHLSQN